MTSIEKFTLEDIEYNPYNLEDDEQLDAIEIPKLPQRNNQTGGANNSDSESINPENNNNTNNANNANDANVSIELDESDKPINPEPSDNGSNSESIDPDASTNNSNSESIELDEPINPEPSNNGSNSNNTESEFELEESNIIKDATKVIISEEIIIPEEKIIANDLDQREDITNEILKLAPENIRNNRNFLKKINNIIDNFISLKEKYSVKDENNEIIDYKINGDGYNSLKEQYLENNFNNTYLIPIVSEKNNLYEIAETEDDFLLGENLDSIENDSIEKKNNFEEINKSIELREKYRKSNARFNYSYKNEINELYNIANNYTNQPQNNTYDTTLDKDTLVLNKNGLYFSKNKFTETENKLHKLNGKSGDFVRGEDVSIAGFLRTPIQKKNIKELFTTELTDIIENKYSLTELYNNLNINNTEIVGLKLDVGTNVLVHFNKDKKEIRGSIVDITDDKYEITPSDIDNPDVANKNILIDKNDIDKGLIYLYNTNDGNRSHLLADENLFRSFMFSEENADDKIDKKKYAEYLDSILPSSKSIIENIGSLNSTDFSEVKEHLRYYGIKYEDITHEAFSNIRDSLKKYNSAKIKDSLVLGEKYKLFINNKPDNGVKNFPFVSNKALKNMEPFYGVYPYYKHSIDSVSQRIKWLQSQPDRGNLYYKIKLKNIEDKININTGNLRQHLESGLNKLESTKKRLVEVIEKDKIKMISDKNKCPSKHIVKEYYSIEELERDNNREIEIDKDKIIVGESRTVKPNTYALLHLPDNKNNKNKFFKRITLADNSEIWNLEPSIELEKIINSNKDFCNQQLKNMGDLELLLNKQKDNLCKFSDIENKCMPRTLENNINKLQDIDAQIQEKKTYLENINSQLDNTENTESIIEYFSNYIKQSHNLQKRIYTNKEEVSKSEEEKEQKDDIDPQYEMLYIKIDLYLEKISKLDESPRFKLLDDLFRKYGRDANQYNNENKNNIYCRYGTKIIGCNHSRYLIDIYANNANNNDNDKIINELIEKYGVEQNGTYWCSNCGNNIYISEYETAEGFKKTGARDITHESIEVEEYESRYENNDLIASLKQHLEHSETMNVDTSSNIINIYNIIKTITNIMGIKLNDTHELTLIKDTELLCATNIKKKNYWINTYTGKKKHTDKAYDNYTNIHTIIYSISMLFVSLQTAIPGYTINKPHPKCKASLEGFPLDKDTEKDQGIRYISCILDQLKTTDSIWKCIKKIKIKTELYKNITKLLDEPYIAHLYNTKRVYLLRTKIHDRKIQSQNEWSNFKPSLEMFNIENESINTTEIKQTTKNRDAISNYFSLKIISEIDRIVNNSAVENHIFSPAILSQSCCLEKIDDSFNNTDYFVGKNKNIELYLGKLNKIDTLENKHYDTRFSISHNRYTKSPSFSNIILPMEEDITPLIISELFENYISSGVFVGKKHIYNNNLCIITGENRLEIRNKKYTIADYYRLLDKINNLGLINNDKISIRINNLKNLVFIINSNPLLKQNTYITNFLSHLIKNNTKNKIDAGWDDMKHQIIEEKKEIIELFENKLGKPKSVIVGKILDNIGSLNNIRNENEEIYGEDRAEKNFNLRKLKLIKKYLISFIFNVINKIQNNSNDEQNDIPESWKLDKSYEDNLRQNLLSENKRFARYINSKTTNNYQIVYDKLGYIISKCSNDIHNIIGEEHIKDCKGPIQYSKCTNFNASIFIEFIFMIVLKRLVNYNNVEPNKTNNKSIDEFDIVISSKDVKSEITDIKSTISNIGEIGRASRSSRSSGSSRASRSSSSSRASNVSEINNASVSEIDNLSEDNDQLLGGGDIELDFEEELDAGNVIENQTSTQIEIADLLYDILNYIEEDREFMDKFTQHNIDESIEKIRDNEKEHVLKFMEDLDKESRQIKTTMISLGLDTWKNMGQKDSEAYLNIQKESAIDESGEINISEEELEITNRTRAAEILGDNYSNNDYQNWLENNNNNIAEDRLQQEEAYVMPDDDGDEENQIDDSLGDDY